MHLKAISQEALMNLIRNMCLEMILLKLRHLLGHYKINHTAATDGCGGHEHIAFLVINHDTLRWVSVRKT